MWKKQEEERTESVTSIGKFCLFVVSVLESFQFVSCYDSGQRWFCQQCYHTEYPEETLSMVCNVLFTPLMGLLFFSFFKHVGC